MSRRAQQGSSPTTYLSAETFGESVCQVMFYVLEDGDVVNYSETVDGDNLEPCRETPDWMPFDVGPDGCRVLRDESPPFEMAPSSSGSNPPDPTGE